MRTITNIDVPEHVWLKQFTKEELRAIAKAHKIMLGRSGSARETARGLAKAWGVQKIMTVFPMRLIDPSRAAPALDRQAIEHLRGLVDILGPCEHVDHHGQCQTHFNEAPCRVAKARQFLAEIEETTP